MKVQGESRLKSVPLPYGTVTELEEGVIDDFIIIDSWKIDFYGETLVPSQYDGLGNAQFGGIANLLLTWKIRQKVYEGVIDSVHRAKVKYSFETAEGKPVVIPFNRRVPLVDICPVCGKQLAVSDLDETDELIELLTGGASSLRYENRVERIYKNGYGALAHRGCVREFYRLEMVDEITSSIDLAFNQPIINGENRFKWEKDGHKMWYELIPNEECSKDCCSSWPWFMFHTLLGDIKVGCRKVGDISITFMPNFARFDMAIFIDDNQITKSFDNKGNRTIFVKNPNHLSKYLTKVHQAILPNKPR